MTITIIFPESESEPEPEHAADIIHEHEHNIQNILNIQELPNSLIPVTNITLTPEQIDGLQINNDNVNNIVLSKKMPNN